MKDYVEMYPVKIGNKYHVHRIDEDGKEDTTPWGWITKGGAERYVKANMFAFYDKNMRERSEITYRG